MIFKKNFISLQREITIIYQQEHQSTMGQYLAIGVTYEIYVNTTKSLRRIEDLESLKNTLNQKYNPTGLYDCRVHGDNVVLTLKDDILLEEWTSVLETFYKLRYRNWSDDGKVLNVLKETNNPDLWFTEKHEPMLTSCYRFGEHGEYYYQQDYYRDYIQYFEKNYGWEIPTTMYSVNLSVDGKAYMEFFGYGVIDFFERLIKDRLQPFRLRDAFNIHFTL